MKNYYFLVLFSFMAFSLYSQNLEFDKEYTHQKISKEQSYLSSLHLKKGETYAISVMQQGIDVVVYLLNSKDSILLEKDSPNGAYGSEKCSFSPSKSGHYTLKIARLTEENNPSEGAVSLWIHEVTKEEIKQKEQNKKEMLPENKKTVTAIDIDHFWEAYDKLQFAKSTKDSLNCIQTIYIDRATDGFEIYLNAKDLTAKMYLDFIRNYPKYLQSIRANTFCVGIFSSRERFTSLCNYRLFIFLSHNGLEHFLYPYQWRILANDGNLYRNGLLFKHKISFA